MSRNLIILLHGVGSSGADLAPLGAAFKQQIPDVDFASPNAPFGNGYGYQWFSINGVTEANRPERVAAARADFDRTASEIIEAHGLTGHPERVAFVGFSQGSIMALDALASGRWPVAAVVAFSGRLASPEPLTPSKTTRTLLIHGDADGIMPVGESERAAAILQGAGLDVAIRILPRLGHTISSDGAQFAAGFLTSVFADTAKP